MKWCMQIYENEWLGQAIFVAGWCSDWSGRSLFGADHQAIMAYDQYLVQIPTKRFEPSPGSEIGALPTKPPNIVAIHSVDLRTFACDRWPCNGNVVVERARDQQQVPKLNEHGSSKCILVSRHPQVIPLCVRCTGDALGLFLGFACRSGVVPRCIGLAWLPVDKRWLRCWWSTAWKSTIATCASPSPAPHQPACSRCALLLTHCFLHLASRTLCLGPVPTTEGLLTTAHSPYLLCARFRAG